MAEIPAPESGARARARISLRAAGRRAPARTSRRRRAAGGSWSPRARSAETAWQVAPAPADLQDRRVEITGPVERKMMINALNSGASVFMADFEDALSPTWENVVEGQVNLIDAVRRADPTSHSPEGKEYTLNDQTATLLVRPRGWHLAERHVLVDGEPISASLFDFGLYFFHNAEELLAPRQRPLLLPAEAGEPPRGARSGTTSSTTPRTRSASRAAPSAPRC